jgi:hypothetical protein
MLADFEIDRDLPSDTTTQSEDDDLELLRKNLVTMLSSQRDETNRDFVNSLAPPPQPDHNPSSEQAEATHKPHHRVIPYAVALHLESVGASWDQARGWTEYLFSQGPNGYRSVAEKDAQIEKAAAQLKTIIKHTLKEEAKHLAAEEKASIACRLIVTNLAADADEKALVHLFREYSRHM